MTLHILSISPANTDVFDSCCAALRPTDALLLLGDGVYAALPESRAAGRLAALPDSITIYAIAEDCAIRAVHERAPRTHALDYPGFVSLACEHARSISWF